MSVKEMVAASLLGRGQPVRISGDVEASTRGLLAQDDAGNSETRRVNTRLTIPADVPVKNRDMAMVAGRDYVVRGVYGGGQFAKTLDLEPVQ